MGSIFILRWKIASGFYFYVVEKAGEALVKDMGNYFNAVRGNNQPTRRNSFVYNAFVVGFQAAFPGG
ncbi:MAG: hypothetical protein U1F27_08300 [Turneriella sp.]